MKNKRIITKLMAVFLVAVLSLTSINIPNFVYAAAGDEENVTVSYTGSEINAKLKQLAYKETVRDSFDVGVYSKITVDSTDDSIEKLVWSEAAPEEGVNTVALSEDGRFLAWYSSAEELEAAYNESIAETEEPEAVEEETTAQETPVSEEVAEEALEAEDEAETGVEAAEAEEEAEGVDEEISEEAEVSSETETQSSEEAAVEEPAAVQEESGVEADSETIPMLFYNTIYFYYDKEAKPEDGVEAESDKAAFTLKLNDDMSHAFAGMTSLTNLSALKYFSFGNVTDVSYMFAGDKALSDISPVASFKTDNLKDVSHIFEGCENLENAAASVTAQDYSIEQAVSDELTAEMSARLIAAGKISTPLEFSEIADKGDIYKSWVLNGDIEAEDAFKDTKVTDYPEWYKAYLERKETEQETADAEPESETEPGQQTETVESTEPEEDVPEDSTEVSEGSSSVIAVDVTENIDFSSKRLIIATKDSDIFIDKEYIISFYNDVYIFQYDDEETAKNAYEYYYDKVDMIDVDTGIMIAEGEAAEEITTDTVMTVAENPLAELRSEINDNAGEVSAEYDIALIDTGAAGWNVAASVSMLGNDVTDYNGHGTAMAEYIAKMAPEAKILSIKAFDENGLADISAVYAAFEYAISQNVKVINLSASAYATAENVILEDAINRANEAGIIVVGAAGNNGKDASYYVPANIDSAFIIGAANPDGTRALYSNYGDCIDYYVSAGTTSEAAAKFSGWLVVNGLEGIQDALGNGFLFAAVGSTQDRVEDISAESPSENLTDISSVSVYEIPSTTITNVELNDGVLTYRLLYAQPIKEIRVVSASRYVLISDYMLEDGVITFGVPDNFETIDTVNIIYESVIPAEDEEEETEDGMFRTAAVSDELDDALDDFEDVAFKTNSPTLTKYASGSLIVNNNKVQLKSSNAWGTTNLMNTGMGLFFDEYDAGGNWGANWDYTRFYSASQAKNCGPKPGDIFLTSDSGFGDSQPTGHVFIVTDVKVVNGKTYVKTFDQTHSGGAGTAQACQIHGWYEWNGYQPWGTKRPVTVRWTCSDASMREMIAETAKYIVGLVNSSTENANAWKAMVNYVTPSNSSSCYVGVMFVLHTLTVPYGEVRVQKNSAIPAVTNRNTHYSLDGATFGVYSDSACTNRLAVLTTNGYGTSNTYRAKVGTQVYIKEITSSPGYKVNSTVYPVTIASTSSNLLVTLDINEPPYVNIKVRAEKVDDATGQAITNTAFTLYEWSDGSDGNPAQWIDKGNLYPNRDIDRRRKDGTYSSGQLYETDLNDGWFMIEETGTPDWYEKNVVSQYDPTTMVGWSKIIRIYGSGSNVYVQEYVRSGNSYTAVGNPVSVSDLVRTYSVENDHVPVTVNLDKSVLTLPQGTYNMDEFAFYYLEWDVATRTYLPTQHPFTYVPDPSAPTDRTKGSFTADFDATKENGCWIKVVESASPEGVECKWTKEMYVAPSTTSANSVTEPIVDEETREKVKVRLRKTTDAQASDSDGYFAFRQASGMAGNEPLHKDAVFKVYKWVPDASLPEGGSWGSAVATLTYNASTGYYESPTILEAYKNPDSTRYNEGKFRLIEERPPSGTYINGSPIVYDFTINNETSDGNSIYAGNGYTVTYSEAIQPTNASNADYVNVITYDFSKVNPLNEYHFEKVDAAGNPIAGVVFRMWSPDGVLFTITTGEEGSDTGWIRNDEMKFSYRVMGNKIHLKEITPTGSGHYTYQEIYVPNNNLKMDPNIYTISVSDIGIVTGAVDTGSHEVVNYPITPLVITKLDANAQKADSDSTKFDETAAFTSTDVKFPAGTAFEIYEWDESANRYKTSPYRTVEYNSAYDRFVDIASNNYPELQRNDTNMGKFLIKETAASPGYHLNSNTYEIQVDSSGDVVSSNPAVSSVYDSFTHSYTIFISIENDPMKFKFYKENSSGDRLEGATFRVFNDNGKSTYVTSDANGVAEIYRLTAGNWYIQEISAPSGYDIDETIYQVRVARDTNGRLRTYLVNGGNETEITELSAFQLIVVDTPSYPLRIVKRDARTHSVVGVTDAFPSGTKFELYEYSQALADEGSNDPYVFVTDIEYEDDIVLPGTGDYIFEENSESQPLIAVIDTGVSSDVRVERKVSVIGGDGTDDNGHGSKMINFIYEENPDARILSIKALDEYGFGNAKDIVNAIHLAVENEADVINISFSAPNNEKNSIVINAVKEATEAGITVVVSAGNSSGGTADYVPACVEEAIVVAAHDENGEMREACNIGSSIDYTIEAATTSEAAARCSGIISSRGDVSERLTPVSFSDGIKVPIDSYASQGDFVIDNVAERSWSRSIKQIYSSWGTDNTYIITLYLERKCNGDIRISAQKSNHSLSGGYVAMIHTYTGISHFQGYGGTCRFWGAWNGYTEGGVTYGGADFKWSRSANNNTTRYYTDWYNDSYYRSNGFWFTLTWWNGPSDWSNEDTHIFAYWESGAISAPDVPAHDYRASSTYDANNYLVETCECGAVRTTKTCNLVYWAAPGITDGPMGTYKTGTGAGVTRLLAGGSGSSYESTGFRRAGFAANNSDYIWSKPDVATSFNAWNTGSLFIPPTGYTWPATATAYKVYNLTKGEWANSGNPINEDSVTLKNIGVRAGDYLAFLAQWRPETYNVTFNLNGGNVGGNTSNVTGWTATYGSNILSNGSTTASIPSNVVDVVRDGYTFAGWYDAATGGKKVYNADGTKYTGDYWNSSGNWIYDGNEGTPITIYAQWASNVYRVTLNKSNGSGGTSEAYYKYNYADGSGNAYFQDVACQTAFSPKNTISVPTRPGYEFLGYYTQTNGGGTQYVNANGLFIGNMYQTLHDNTTLYAAWNSLGYTIEYRGTGVQTAESILVKNDVSVPINGSVFTAYQTTPAWANDTSGITNQTLSNPGYRFVGWSLENGGLAQYFEGDTVNNLAPLGQTVTLWAVWEPDVTTSFYDSENSIESLELPWLHVSGDNPDGKFKIVETAVSDGYVFDSSHKPTAYLTVDKENGTYTIEYDEYTYSFDPATNNGLQTGRTVTGTIDSLTNTVEVAFVNQPTGYIIRKVDSDNKPLFITDINGTPIKGATFQYTKLDETGAETQWITVEDGGANDYDSLINGYITIVGLPIGTYHYREVEAPSSDYALDTQVYSFEVKEQGFVDGTNPDGTIKYTDVSSSPLMHNFVVNSTEFRIQKITDKGNVVPDVRFEVENNSTTTTVITDEEGQVNLTQYVQDVINATANGGSSTIRFRESPTQPDLPAKIKPDTEWHELIISKSSTGLVSATLDGDAIPEAYTYVHINKVEEYKLYVTKADKELGFTGYGDFPSGTEFDVYEWNSETGEYEYLTTLYYLDDILLPHTGDIHEDEESVVPTGGDQPLIAVIDTGVSSDVKVERKVSVIGGDGTDDNGHGSKMVNYIYEENPNARILSIKALDEFGFGEPEDIVAAINYAVEAGADVINMSFVGANTEKNQIVADAVKSAVGSGITVVVAAGNNGGNTADYVAANVEEAVVIAAHDNTGAILESSNMGETVDYSVLGQSTSEAAARYTGKLTTDDFTDVLSCNAKTSVISSEPTDGGFVIASESSWSVSASYVTLTVWARCDGKDYWRLQNSWTPDGTQWVCLFNFGTGTGVTDWSSLWNSASAWWETTDVGGTYRAFNYVFNSGYTTHYDSYYGLISWFRGTRNSHTWSSNAYSGVITSVTPSHDYRDADWTESGATRGYEHRFCATCGGAEQTRPITYTVLYTGNGGYYNGSNTYTWSNTATFGQTYTVEPNFYTKPGYVFTMWLDSTGNPTTGNWTGWSGRWNYIDGQYGITNRTLTLTAQWSAETYNVNFDLNGGNTNGNTANETGWTITYGANTLSKSGTTSTIPARLLDWTRVGFDNGGWYDAASSGNKAYNADGTKYAGTYWDSSGNWIYDGTDNQTITLYARLVPHNYKVTFNNMGAQTAGTQELYFKSRISGSATPPFYFQEAALTTPISANDSITIPVKTGYTFGGYWTEANGQGERYFEEDGAVDRYMDVRYGTSDTLLANADANNGLINLYAKWTANTYTVHFDANGGSGSMADQSFTYGTAQNLTANAFTRAGKIFAGWNTAADGSGDSYVNQQSVQNLTAVNNGTVTLYAQWNDAALYVRFNANGGSGEMPAQVYTPNQTAALHNNAFTKTGYHFTKWTLTPANSGTSYNNQQVVSYSDFTPDANGYVDLYAQWALNTYKVRFMANGGSGSMADQDFTYGTAQNLTANAFTRSGYTFAGWNTSINSSGEGTGTSYSNGQNVNNLTTVNNDTVYLYAIWTPNHYFVHFDGNGSYKGSMSNQEFVYGTPSNLSPNAYERLGYVFAGWNTAANGSGTLFADEQSVSNLTADNGATITLYARWELEHDVEFYKNASGTPIIPILERTEKNEGKYRIVETHATDGYIMDSSEVILTIAPDGSYYTITKDGETTTHTLVDTDIVYVPFVNEPNEYIIYKEDKNGTRLSGATFKYGLTEENEANWTTVTDGGTGDWDATANGEIHLKYIAPGDYSYKETAAPSGYLPSVITGRFTVTEQGIAVGFSAGGSIEYAKSASAVVKNDQEATAYLLKTDKITGLALPGVNFDFAYSTEDNFGVNGQSTTIATNAEGYIDIGTELRTLYQSRGINTIYFRESAMANQTVLPARAIIDQTVHSLRIDASNKLYLDNEELPTNRTFVLEVENYTNPQVRILKKDAVTNLPLKGAGFSIYPANNMGALFTITDGTAGDLDGTANGEIVLSGLEGNKTYVVKETIAPAGYAVNPVEYRFRTYDDNNDGLIDSVSFVGGTKTDLLIITVTDTPNNKPLVITKIDENGNKLTGAQFTINYTPLSGAAQQYTVAETNGSYLEVSGETFNVKPGSYRIAETRAPVGYEDISLADNVINFSVDISGNVTCTDGRLRARFDEETQRDTIYITFTNKKVVTTSIKLQKIDLESREVLKDVVFKVQQWDNKGTPDISDDEWVDGAVLSINGVTTVRPTLTGSTDANGNLTFSGLKVTDRNEGRYRAVETTSLDGYVDEKKIVTTDGNVSTEQAAPAGYTPPVVNNPDPGRSSVSTVNADTDLVLNGYVYIPENPNGKTVIICHGLGGFAEQADPIAAYLADNGYTAFAFDFAGGSSVSTSEGLMSDMSVLTEKKDLECIYDYVASQPYVDEDNIYMAGHSQGALVTGLYAAEHPADVKGLVFYAPGFVVAKDWAPKNEAEIATNWVGWDNEATGRKYFEDLWTLLHGDGDLIYSLMAEYRGPVLMIQGTSDATTSPAYTRTMNSYYNNSVLKEYAGADHVFTGETNHQKLLADTLEFLDNQIIVPSTFAPAKDGADINIRFDDGIIVPKTDDPVIQIENTPTEFFIQKVNEDDQFLTGVPFKVWTNRTGSDAIASNKMNTEKYYNYEVLLTDGEGLIPLYRLKRNTIYLYQEQYGDEYEINKNFARDDTVYAFYVDAAGIVHSGYTYEGSGVPVEITDLTAGYAQQTGGQVTEKVVNTLDEYLGYPVIYKFDAETLDPIEGITFDVYEWDAFEESYLDDDPATMPIATLEFYQVYSITVDGAPHTYNNVYAIPNDHGLQRTNYNLGKFLIKETASAEHYTNMDAAGNVKQVEIEILPNGITEQVFYNEISNMPNILRVKKIDRQTNAEITGAEFNLSSFDGFDKVGNPLTGATYNETKSAGNASEVSFTSLSDGNYVLTESKAPSGYSMDYVVTYEDGEEVEKSTPYYFIVTGGAIYEAEPDGSGGLWVKGADVDNPAEPISPDVSFEVKNTPNVFHIDKYAEDEFTPLPGAGFTFTVLNNPIGVPHEWFDASIDSTRYEMDGSTITETIEREGGVTENITYTLPTDLAYVVKGCNASGASLADTWIHSGDTLYTDADGKIEIKTMADGIWKWEETAAPSPYDQYLTYQDGTPAHEGRFVVIDGEIFENAESEGENLFNAEVFNSEPVTLDMHLRKQSESGEILEDAVFSVYAWDEDLGDYLISASTFTIECETCGMTFANEADADEHAHSTRHTVIWKENVHDAAIGTFTYNPVTQVYDYTFDEYLSAATKFKVIETKAPQGYAIYTSYECACGEEFETKALADAHIEEYGASEEDVHSISIIYHDTMCEVDLYGNPQVTLSGDGHTSFDNATITLTAENTPHKVTVEKVSAEAPEEKLSDAKFLLFRYNPDEATERRDANDKFIGTTYDGVDFDIYGIPSDFTADTSDVIAQYVTGVDEYDNEILADAYNFIELTTDEDGKIQLRNLIPGESYGLVETAPPPGYMYTSDNSMQIFKVSENGLIFDQQEYTIEMNNLPIHLFVLLPTTGGLGRYGWYFIGCGALLIAITVTVIVSKKKKKKDDIK